MFCKKFVYDVVILSSTGDRSSEMLMWNCWWHFKSYQYVCFICFTCGHHGPNVPCFQKKKDARFHLLLQPLGPGWLHPALWWLPRHTAKGEKECWSTTEKCPAGRSDLELAGSIRLHCHRGDRYREPERCSIYASVTEIKTSLTWTGPIHKIYWMLKNMKKRCPLMKVLTENKRRRLDPAIDDSLEDYTPSEPAEPFDEVDTHRYSSFPAAAPAASTASKPHRTPSSTRTFTACSWTPGWDVRSAGTFDNSDES